MSLTGLPQFDRTVNRTNQWLVDVQEALDLPDEHRNEAYHALRAVLQALRDRITPGEATDLGAQQVMAREFGPHFLRASSFPTT